MSCALTTRTQRASPRSDVGHIWLIGMMGSGKTTVGEQVALVLQLPFIDVDHLIVETYNRTIEDMFAEGEEVFRGMERDTIALISQKPDAVVATGGGSVLDPDNVTTMRATGATVLLTATTETMVGRLEGTADRPLLRKPDDIEAIATARSALYVESADVIIDTTDRNVDDVVNEVVRCAGM